ncbi:FAD-dependent oxidoreductase [Pseudenhygromyxa sp. WMMC2535]|nr:FAD-dependent oxidoreductase [Pseudenhygromyxa sp. WMMC2535]
MAIVGAGVVGCALAQALSLAFASSGRDPSRIILLEAAAREGTGISARNSGVVHAGLYYAPGSRKARWCVEGNRLIWEWVAARGVGHRRTGKLVVATGRGAELDAEREALEALRRNAAAAGVELEALSLTQARELEPALPSSVGAAMWSPSSGIVDAHGLVRSLLAAAVERGVEFVPQTRVEVVEPGPGGRGYLLRTDRGSIHAERLINAAGLHATSLAAQLGCVRALYPARGDYFRLRCAPWTWRRLIYPVTRPGSPSLGVHLTLELDGSVRLGPDLEWLPSARREDYGPATGETKLPRFLAAAERLLGGEHLARADALRYDGCGIRPKLVGAGEGAADFEIVEWPRGAWHLLGIESPGLTSAMALARALVEGVDA